MGTRSPLVTWGRGRTMSLPIRVSVHEKLYVRSQEESDSHTSLATKNYSGVTVHTRHYCVDLSLEQWFSAVLML